MPALALSIDVTDRPALVVGAGAVATRKARKLAAAGARVRLVAPEACAEARALVDGGLAVWDARAVRLPDDVVGAFLVVVATNDASVNAAAASAARTAGALVNAAHEPAHGDVTFPATVLRGDLCLAVSTGAEAPALARAIARQLDATLDPAWGALVTLGGAVRAHLRATGAQVPRERWEHLTAPTTLAALRAGDLPALERVLQSAFGPACSWRALGLAPPTPSPEPHLASGAATAATGPVP